MFFFEKKNQKTFIRSVPVVPTVSDRREGRKNKSFLVLFFKKEHFLPFSPRAAP
jgi:hypothetical protein